MTMNVFDLARLVLLDRGHTRLTMCAPDGRVCLLGAVLAADGWHVDAAGNPRSRAAEARTVELAKPLATVIRDLHPLLRATTLSDVDVITVFNDQYADAGAVDEVLAGAAELVRHRTATEAARWRPSAHSLEAA